MLFELVQKRAPGAVFSQGFVHVGGKFTCGGADMPTTLPARLGRSPVWGSAKRSFAKDEVFQIPKGGQKKHQTVFFFGAGLGIRTPVTFR